MSNPFTLTNEGRLVIENIDLGISTCADNGNPDYGEGVDIARAFENYPTYARYSEEPISPASFLNWLGELFRGTGSERQAILEDASSYLGAEFLPLFERNHGVYEERREELTNGRGAEA